MSQPNVVPRINSRILMADREYLDLTATSKGQFLLKLANTHSENPQTLLEEGVLYFAKVLCYPSRLLVSVS